MSIISHYNENENRFSSTVHGKRMKIYLNQQSKKGFLKKCRAACTGPNYLDLTD